MLELVLELLVQYFMQFIYNIDLICTCSERELMESSCGRSIQRYNENYPEPIIMLCFSVLPCHHTHRAPPPSC